MVCSSASSVTTAAMMSSLGDHLQLQLDRMCFAVTADATGHKVGLATVPQQLPQSWVPLQAFANYAMGPSRVSFSLRVESPTNLCI